VAASRRLERFPGRAKLLSRPVLRSQVARTPVELTPAPKPEREITVLAPMPPPPPPSPPPKGKTPEEVFLENLPVIQEIVSHCCARRLSRQEAEDFSQTVMCRLIENEYRIIREFRGRSSLRSYLAVAIRRMLLDYLNHIWGKWHPSAEAKRLGPIAIRLEELLYRDRLSLDEACRILLRENPEISRQKIETLAARIPFRFNRRFDNDDVLENTAEGGLGPEERLEAKELGIARRRIWGTLLRCIKALKPEDQVLVWLRVELSVAEIARVRRMDQKPLYRRLNKIYERLQKALIQNGIRRQDVREILDKLQPGLLDF
jgi:RNA polymerase sigma factor (sigma-70 family)